MENSKDYISNAAISSKMSLALSTWSAMYEDNAPWLHEPTTDDPTRIISLGLPAFIASEKARMATLEMKSEITSPKDDSGNIIKDERTEFLNDQYQRKVISKIRTQLEYGIAKGGLVIKPYLNYNEQSPSDSEFDFDFIQADGFYPLSFDHSGSMTEAAFLQRKVDRQTIYTRVEHHIIENGTVTITNKAYKANNSQNKKVTSIADLGVEVPLTDVEEWAGIEPEQNITNVDRLLFAYFKMPDANTVDPYSPLGVSGYSRAVSLIEQADLQYSRLMWEFEGGELAVDVDRNALKPVNTDDDDYTRLFSTSRVAQMQQRLFRRTNIDEQAGETYEVFSPSLRDASLINGLNTLLMRIEDVIGISRGTLSDVNREARTATELKTNKQRSYQSNSEIQKAIEAALRDVVYVMNAYVSLYELLPDSEYEVSFEWDDSIVVDMEEELATRINLLHNGIESKLNIRMWYFGETEEQALTALEEIEREKKAEMQATIDYTLNDLGNQ